MTSPIPVGLIGLGRHGSRYLRHLLEEETGGQLVAICRQQLDEGQRQAARHHLQFFSDYRDLIADPTIQAVLVVGPPDLNFSIALEAIKHRKALLLEKPLALNSHEGKHIVEAAKQAGVPLMTGHTLRYEPVIRKIQEIASTLGTWQSLRGTMHLEERLGSHERQKTGYGVLLEFGIHLLDWVHVMLPGEPLSVSTDENCRSPHDIEKHADIHISTRSGLSCHLNIARIPTKRVTQLEITGAKGRVQGDWTTGRVKIFHQKKLLSEEIVPPTSTIVLLLKDFFKGLITGQSFPITGEDGLRAVELIEACNQAATTGQKIYVK